MNKSTPPKLIKPFILAIEGYGNLSANDVIDQILSHFRDKRQDLAPLLRASGFDERYTNNQSLLSKLDVRNAHIKSRYRPEVPIFKYWQVPVLDNLINELGESASTLQNALVAANLYPAADLTILNPRTRSYSNTSTISLTGSLIITSSTRVHLKTGE
jgi:c-di-AMP phosphodiesterase-like protein